MSILDYKTYEEAKEKFNWDQVWDVFDGDADNLNIAHECIDRHVGKGTALRLKFDDGRTEKYTFDQLSKWTSQFAHALKDIGIGPGDRVTIMLDPCWEYYVSLFGTLKLGAHAVPCFTLFAPENVEFRIKDSNSTILITNGEMAKLIDNSLVKKVIVVGDDFNNFIKDKPESIEIYPTKAKDVAVLQYTSGTTKKHPDAIPHYHTGTRGKVFLPVFTGVGIWSMVWNMYSSGPWLISGLL
jgi:acetyl-CoA synthetase